MGGCWSRNEETVSINENASRPPSGKATKKRKEPINFSFSHDSVKHPSIYLSMYLTHILIQSCV